MALFMGFLGALVFLLSACGGGGGGGGGGAPSTPRLEPVVTFAYPNPYSNLSFTNNENNLPDYVEVRYSDAQGGLNPGSFNARFSFQGFEFDLTPLFTAGETGAITGSAPLSPFYRNVVAAIAPGSGTLNSYHETPSAPKVMAFNAQTGTLYLADAVTAKIYSMAGSPRAVTHSISVTGRVAAMVVEPGSGRLFAAMDSSNILKTFPADLSVESVIILGSEPESVTQGHGKVFAPLKTGTTVAVISGAAGALEQNADVGFIPIIILPDPDDQGVLYALGRSSSMSATIRLYKIENLATVQMLTSVGAYPQSAVLDSGAGAVWVADYAHNTVVPVALNPPQALDPVPVGALPVKVIADPSQFRVFVLSAGGDSLAILDSTTRTVSRTVQLSGDPSDFALDAGGNILALLDLWDVSSANVPLLISASVADAQGHIGAGSLTLLISPETPGDVDQPDTP